MAGADQHGIDVLVQLQVFLVECNLAIGGLRLSESPNSGKPVGAQVGQDVLDAV